MTKDKVIVKHGSGVDLEAYFNAVRQLYAAHDAELECTKCGRVMADDECGDEFPEERVCDECAGITPEVQESQTSWNGDYGFEGIWREV